MKYAKDIELSKDFTLHEFLKSNCANRKGYEEQFNPPAEVIENLRALCVNVLQPLRDAVGKPIRVTSGYRCSRVNRDEGGSSTSEHLKGRAADIELWIEGKEQNQLLFDKIVSLRLPFRQLIDEFGTETDPAWIHVSYNAKDVKRQKLRARYSGGKVLYSAI
jgi:zinc D-Ala-D-Ala carboxypeptidase